MHAQIRIRPAEPADSAELLSLIHWAMRTYAEASGIPGQVDALREGESDLISQIEQHKVLVAEHRGSLIGTVRLVHLDNQRAYFSRFAVHPHLQKSGVGRLLYQAAETQLIEQGYQTVELHTALTNQPLVNFYQSRGFELVSVDPSRGYPRGLFRKKLSA